MAQVRRATSENYATSDQQATADTSNDPVYFVIAAIAMEISLRGTTDICALHGDLPAASVGMTVMSVGASPLAQLAHQRRHH